MLNGRGDAAGRPDRGGIEGENVGARRRDVGEDLLLTSRASKRLSTCLGQLNAVPEDFLHVSSHPLYDHIPMYNIGFRDLVMLDRGAEPVAEGYNITVVKSLDELNKHLGL